MQLLQTDQQTRRAAMQILNLRNITCIYLMSLNSLTAYRGEGSGQLFYPSSIRENVSFRKKF